MPAELFIHFLTYPFFNSSPVFTYLLAIFLSSLSSLSSFLRFSKDLVFISHHFLSSCNPFFKFVFVLPPPPPHVYSSRLFPDSLRDIIHVPGCSSLGSVPSSLGSPEIVHCLLSILRLHEKLLFVYFCLVQELLH